VLKELFKTNVSRLSVKIAPDWLVRCSMVNTQDRRPPVWQRPDEGLAEVKDQELLAVLKELFETNISRPPLLCASDFLDRCSLDKTERWMELMNNHQP